MVDFSQLHIEYWLSAFMLPFFRVASFFMAMPIIGTQLVTAPIRLSLALAVTLLLLPVLPDQPMLDGLSLDTWLRIAQQVLIGSALGFTLHVMFQVVTVGGQMIANQMGLGFASMTDPANGVSVVVLGQFYLTMATLLFLAFDGHLVMISTLAASFDIFPTGLLSLSRIHLMDIALSGTWMFSGAVLMALPAVTALLVINLAFGIMVKAAPQLNIFAIGFPFTMTMGLFITWLSFAGFLGQFEQLNTFVLSHIAQLLERG